MVDIEYLGEEEDDLYTDSFNVVSFAKLSRTQALARANSRASKTDKRRRLLVAMPKREDGDENRP
jgi:hypothetical protein